MTAIRLPVSFVLALGATATVFWFLSVLTAVDPHVAFIRITPIEFTTKIPEPEIERPPHVKPTIRRPRLPNATIVSPGTKQPPDLGPSPTRLPGEWFGPGDGLLPRGGDAVIARSGGTDRGPVPQVRLEPEYPAAVKARGIEGWITFRFTVAVDGSVTDIEILDAKPARVFDGATLRAVSSWKYQPAMRDGRPVEQRGVTVTYRYELER